VVDDHNLFRRGLISLLAQDRRFAVVGEAADAGAAQLRAADLQPDVILLDNHLPGVSGISAIAALKETAPQARVLMLTVSESEEDLATGLRAGADGYLLKTINIEDLAASILRVSEGDSVVSPEMLGKLVAILRAAPEGADPVATSAMPEQVDAGLPADDPIHRLSPRELEILALIARGDSNKEIGRALDIAETTVKIHVQRILRKLSLGNRVHAAVYAAERGIG
jgi:two-component system nitrate/nitrite response regulator NarL